MRCPICNASGRCQACRGSGRSGYFLVNPGTSAKPCWQCLGAGKCNFCGGKGEVEKVLFAPYICVEHSLRIPASITIAAITGAHWRFIEIPLGVLARTVEAQRGWVAWRIRQHFRANKGMCFLFGSIVGYRWQQDAGRHIRFSTNGRASGH
jgi:hypothetical protein